MSEQTSSLSQTESFHSLEQRIGEDEARLLLIHLEQENGIVSELRAAWSYEDRWRSVLGIPLEAEVPPLLH